MIGGVTMSEKSDKLRAMLAKEKEVNTDED